MDIRPTPEEAKAELTLAYILDQFKDCADFTHRSFPNNGASVVYLSYLVGNDELLREIVKPLSGANDEEAAALLECDPYSATQDATACLNGILDGSAAIFFRGRAWLVGIGRPIGRTIEQSETESVIAGPHDGFVEDLYENLAVLRKRIKSPKLKTVFLSVGEITRTTVALVYLEGIANREFLGKLIGRIEGAEIDGVFESNMFIQLIDDNPNSVFPQYMTTERPDSIASKILGGRIAALVDGSPSVFSCPTSFFDFFSSPDDYYQRWMLGTALRLLRIIGFIVTIGFTAFYVSVTTYHYEMIPHTMLLNLTESRSKVPFPPLIEALLMETTIELLREAGARLPTKIGQTIGIVGGIVIGQAAVQAGFTSNILIIAVATSAIASFVIPSYVMSASLRLIRFGLIIMAGVLGNLGLFMGIGLVVIQLAGITNLGASYLTPIAPVNFRDMLDTFIRGPFWALTKRPSITRTPNKIKNKMKK
ncbi:spore germination protein [Cohnella xylanilytica]|uniref:Spore germination protein n=1 Tax=Cohnella xylanilytica TaxID=557555 RepID=A0A841U3R9_9BACL|nr:spore germination protein [Cohnella xylanilytica]MBB6694162.1 spore germination protein [Cohnella xylanilytica]GIO11034.1 spore germination protein [Cohnella xylanilytica]